MDDNTFTKYFNKNKKDRFEWLNSLLYDGCGLCHPSLLIRKDAYRQFGLPAYGLDSIPDYRKWIRLCILSDIHVLDEKLTSFRIRKNGMNTSGDRPEKHFRNTTEMFFVLKEFLLFKNSDDFVRAFPAAEKYLINGEMLIPFAFARLLLDTMSNTVYHLFAFDVLFNLFQDKSSRETMENLYGYTLKNFNIEKQQHDIFRIFPQEQFMTCKVYADFGSGFSETDSVLIENIYVSSLDNFSFDVDISGISAGRQPLTVRLDIDKGVFRKFSNVELICGDAKCPAVSATPFTELDGWKCYITPFPSFVFDAKSGNGIFVCSGKTVKASNWDTDNLINSDNITEDMLFDRYKWFRDFKDRQNAQSNEIASLENALNQTFYTRIKHLCRRLLHR